MTQINMAELLTQFSLKGYEVKTFKKRTTYLIPIQLLSILGAKPWSRQRPVDENRVEEIGVDIEESENVSGMISMAWHPKEQLVVYDGQHRWSALNHIYSVNKGFIIQIFIEIMWNATEDEIVKAFKSINQSVSVSELYMLDPTAEADHRKLQIQEFASDLARKYNTFTSTSPRPNRPNFNRDVLINELYELSTICNVPFNAIEKAILAVNDEYHNNMLSSARTLVKRNQKTYEKCDKNKFWLFAETGHLNYSHIKNKINV